MIRYIANEAHYTEVIERIRQYLWIGTADIKDLYFLEGRGSVPLLKVFEDLIRRGGTSPLTSTNIRCSGAVWSVGCARVCTSRC